MIDEQSLRTEDWELKTEDRGQRIGDFFYGFQLIFKCGTFSAIFALLKSHWGNWLNNCFSDLSVLPVNKT